MSPTGTSAHSRRRQRSTRITVSAALLVLAALLVGWAVLDNLAWLRSGAAIAAVVLGAAATRIMHSELMLARRDANRDRATQARAYRTLTDQRLAQHRGEVESLQDRILAREAEAGELELALIQAQHRAADASRKYAAEARRASLAADELASLTRRADDADERAAEAIVLLAELEQETDVLRAELAAWQSAAPQPQRRHA